MNELKVFNFNEVDVVDSREVARLVERPHNDLMKSIRVYADYISNAGDFSLVDFFIPSTYQDSKGETRPCYLITKKGCDMVANKMTGEKGVLFTAAYVSAFEKMREQAQAAFQSPASKELKAIFMLDNRTVQHEQRITALEDTMVVDYGQQRTLTNQVNAVVISALGGSDSPAYHDKHVRGKVYSECNRDIQNWFRVNSRNNVPRKRFDEAVEYIQRWRPSTNMSMTIRQTNGQMQL
jgi:Rha family phage regulatory protein